MKDLANPKTHVSKSWWVHFTTVLFQRTWNLCGVQSHYKSCQGEWTILAGLSLTGNFSSCRTVLLVHFFKFSRILNSRGERPLTAYLIHSLPLQQSAVQVFAGDKMSVVGHLVGLEQIGYEKILGMTMAVSIVGSSHFPTTH